MIHPTTIWGAILWAACGLLITAFLKGLYNAFLHPLAKVPGPKLYAFSQIPYLFHLVRGSWPRTLKEFHDHYGPVVRFGCSDVSFTTADAWQKIYGFKSDGQAALAKDKRFYRPRASGYSDLIVANDEDHRRMRRLVSHAFSEKALRAQEDVMKYYIDLLTTRLTEAAHRNEVVNIVQWFNFTTFDLIGDLAFGEPFGCLESGQYHPWVSMIFNAIKWATFTQAMERLPILKLVALVIMPRDLPRQFQEHRELSKRTAMRRIESKNTEREDFMSYILRHNDEKGMSTGEIVENANLLIVAGSETTATLLSGTIFYLLSNRDIYAKLVDEIRHSFASEDEITLLRVNNMEYLKAVLTESSRMYPPIAVGAPRMVGAGGQAIEEYWLPENTGVSVSAWSAYQSERYWREPQKFDPERWLGDPKYTQDTKTVLNPFSLGPRNCIGKNLAYAEMRLIIARLLWKFDWELMPESKDWNQQDNFLFWEKGELRVKMTDVRGKPESQAAVAS